MKVTEQSLRSLAAEIEANPSCFDKSQQFWGHYYRTSANLGDALSEFSLVRASFPACFALHGWYPYFHQRAETLLASASLTDLSSDCVSELDKLRKRYAAFAGSFRCKPSSHGVVAQSSSKRALTIGIDVRPLSIPSSRKRGIGRYLINTLRELVNQAGAHKLVLFTDMSTIDNEMRSVFHSPAVSYRNIVPNCDYDLDVFLLTDPTPMMTGRRVSQLPIASCAWMSIIYDFIPLEFPELYLRGNTVLVDEYLENIETVASRAQAVFPISRYVAEQCESLFGLSAERVIPIYGGVEDRFFESAESSAEIRRKIGSNYFLYVGGADARKNIAGLVASFAKAVDSLPNGSKLVLAGEMTPDKTRQLLQDMQITQLDGRVVSLGNVSDDVLIKLYANALATVFVSHSEGLGLPALEAMAAGCPVIASKTSALGETVTDAGLLVDPSSNDDIASAMIRLSTDNSLRSKLVDRGKPYARKWKWQNVARELLNGIEKHATKAKRTTVPVRRLRVAMLNRDNVWSAPGGDSKIMMQMKQAAQLRDIDVSFPGALDQAYSADIVHFVNMTLPAPLDAVAKWSSTSKKPLLVTTLYEDWPRFLNASHQAFGAYHAFLAGKLSYGALQDMLVQLQDAQPAPRVNVSRSIEAASLLLACGDSEAARLRNDFPNVADRVTVVPFEVNAPLAVEQKTIASLRESLGLDEFVLCIGRLETRKNQLALLAALHDENIPIVFAAGDYTPHPSYSEAVRKWKRKAPVRVLDRMPWHLMSVVIRAAAVHALPSFYELPGLVHLECAAAGTPIVAGEWGALNDYFPEACYRPCNPLDLESIRTAVLSALREGASPGSVEIATGYSQARLADGLHRVYESAVTQPKRVLNQTIDTIHGSRTPKVFGGIHVPA